MSAYHCDRCGSVLNAAQLAGDKFHPECAAKYNEARRAFEEWFDDDESDALLCFQRHFRLLIQAGNGLACRHLNILLDTGMDTLPDLVGMVVDVPSDIPGYCEWLEAYERRNFADCITDNDELAIDIELDRRMEEGGK